MCGRYLFDDEADIEEINKIVSELNSKYSGTEVLYKTGEIFPTNNAPVLSLIDGKPALSVMRWGFPKWDSKSPIINAKSETAHEKKMFAKPLIEKRCVILSTGFYEWQKKEASKAKNKYHFTSCDVPMLYMAGLYNVFKTEEQQSECFVILTREANKYISEIHNRMPVVLQKDELLNWLKDDGFISMAFKRDDTVLSKKFVG